MTALIRIADWPVKPRQTCCSWAESGLTADERRDLRAATLYKRGGGRRSFSEQRATQYTARRRSAVRSEAVTRSLHRDVRAGDLQELWALRRVRE